jgi:hypothetical protein
VIDTYNERFEGSRLKGYALPNGWSRRDSKITDSRCTRAYWRVWHRQTSMNVAGYDVHVTSAEASLPRLLYGHNGRLITGDSEIEAGVARFRDLLDEIATPPDDFRVGRVDLAWHLEVDVRTFLNAYMSLSHKRIRSVPEYHVGNSLEFIGTYLACRFYDKQFLATRSRGGPLRCEFQCGNHKAVSKQFNGNLVPVKRIKFDEAYRVFREIAQGFAPARVPKITERAEAFAVAMEEGVTVNNVPAFEFFTAHLGEKQRRRLRQEVAVALRNKGSYLSLDKAFPPDGPPLARHCDPSKKRGSQNPLPTQQ